jgi:hypothetical protein
MAYTWSERTTVDTLAADTEAVANVLPGDAQTELVVSTGGLVKVVPSASLDGGWGAPVTLQTGTPAANLTDVEAYGVPFENRVYVVSVGGGTVRFRCYDSHDWKQVGEATDIYEPSGSPRFPAMAVHPHSWRFFVAHWSGAAVLVTTSPDRGMHWHVDDGLLLGLWAAQIMYLQYPAIYCDRTWLHLVGYMPWERGVLPPTAQTYRGATGRLLYYRFRATALMEPDNADPTAPPTPASAPWDQYPAAEGSPVVVGPCDECRPALTRRPGTLELVCLGAKTGATWDDIEGADSGIVCFMSPDNGATWALDSFHAVP